jgi:heme-degrading monooxygenase HmoA
LSEIEPAQLPEPPYYAVIFASVRTDGDNGYAQRSQQILKLAADQPGFLGVDLARGPVGLGITVSYWRDGESIKAWRDQTDHTQSRADGRAHWYESFALHVAKVERSYGFQREMRLAAPPIEGQEASPQSGQDLRLQYLAGEGNSTAADDDEIRSLSTEAEISLWPNFRGVSWRVNRRGGRGDGAGRGWRVRTSVF